MNPRITAALKELEAELGAALGDAALHSWTLFAFNGAGRVSVFSGDCASCRVAIAKIAIKRSYEDETAPDTAHPTAVH